MLLALLCGFGHLGFLIIISLITNFDHVCNQMMSGGSIINKIHNSPTYLLIGDSMQIYIFGCRMCLCFTNNLYKNMPTCKMNPRAILIMILLKNFSVNHCTSYVFYCSDCRTLAYCCFITMHSLILTLGSKQVSNVALKRHLSSIYISQKHVVIIVDHDWIPSTR